MTRIGFAQGYSPKLNVREMAEWVRQADERGYELGFFSETIEIMRDSVSAMTAFALATKKINIGCTQIVRLRSPVIHGQTVATIDELSEGRFILAPGACTKTHAFWNSLEPDDPVVSLKEYITAIRRMVAGEKQIVWQGETIKLDRVELAWEPYRREIPMWIAATSKTGLKVAGEIGSIVILSMVLIGWILVGGILFLLLKYLAELALLMASLGDQQNDVVRLLLDLRDNTDEDISK